MKKLYVFYICSCLLLTSCNKDYLDVLPEDRIITTKFWDSASDVEMALSGVYAVLRERAVYGAGPSFEAATPDGYQWSYWNGTIQQIGNGSITPTSDGVTAERWTMCYRIINRTNYLLENMGKAPVADNIKAVYKGEATFLRGVAYALLAESYGGVPIVLKSFNDVREATAVSRETRENTWAQAIKDYDAAIAVLPVNAAQPGRATKGAALGLKMRAYLYQNKYTEVLAVVKEIDALGKYSLFPSYKGLFEVQNENNNEVLFDIQYIDGEQGQGNYFAWLGQPVGITTDLGGASCVAPTQQMVDKYETISGLPVNPADPYTGRDPRLDFTILRPGATFEGKAYPTVIKNHTGQRVGFNMRKYLAEGVKVNTAMQNPINFIVLRYADVLLSKAEAILGTGGSVADAVAILNRIRTERTDVKISLLPAGLSLPDAVEKLRHERRIEFFLEGTYWADIKRWNIGSKIYPAQIKAADGSLIETKFPNGYKEKDNLLPIPENERAYNPKLGQNPGW